MSSSILHPPAHLPPSVALQLSQQAPAILSRPAPSSSSYSPASLLFSKPETAEIWTVYENLLLSCLRTGDEQSARTALQRLEERFGASNEKVQALHGIFMEATAVDDAALKRVLAGYDSTLKGNPSNMPIAKRKIALLRSLGREPEAIAALTRLLEVSPTDAEAWAELADLYHAQGLHQQAIFSLEEVLLITPNAWNLHARLGELLYVVAGSNGGDGAEKLLAESLRRFCRSIELCDDYLRGFYGLKLTSARLLSLQPQSSRPLKGDDTLPTPSVETIQQLNQRATAKLAEIVRKSAGGQSGWGGYDTAELIAARALLDGDTVPTTR